MTSTRRTPGLTAQPRWRYRPQTSPISPRIDPIIPDDKFRHRLQIYGSIETTILKRYMKQFEFGTWFYLSKTWENLKWTKTLTLLLYRIATENESNSNPNKIKQAHASYLPSDYVHKLPSRKPLSQSATEPHDKSHTKITTKITRPDQI